MRILFADSNHPVLHETLRASGFECDLFWDKSVTELQELLPAYEGLVIRSRFAITKEILERATKLKCIGRVGAGMENIDTAYAAKKRISCVCAPEGNRDAVGEHVIGMLLMLLNHLGKADAEVRRGVWLRAENRGTEIGDKTIGIIGYGNMGGSFAKKLLGFGCRIIVYDKYKKGFGNSLVREVSLETILEESDIISLHVPLTTETKYLLDAAFFGKLKKQAYIVNTSRGGCLNTADLVEALKTGKVKGACLDVLEYESISFENIQAREMPEPMKYLVASDKVILSPHIAGWSQESNYKMSRLIAEKMIALLSPKSRD